LLGGVANTTLGSPLILLYHYTHHHTLDRSRGMDITVVTTATNDDEGRALLKQLGFPFKEN
jgi:large subunit ribosomal protein L5